MDRLLLTATVHPDGEPLQAFTAIGQVVDDEPYQVEMTDDFHPWRRNVDFLSCTETPIRPLIDRLDFIEDKRRWGYKFRFGVFRIDDHDLEVIRSAMTGRSRTSLDLFGPGALRIEATSVASRVWATPAVPGVLAPISGVDDAAS